MNLLRSLISLIVMWALGAIILRVALGTNYEGSAIVNDLKINLGIVLFFLGSSGFALTYAIKSRFLPLIRWHDAALSAGLFAVHAVIYIGLFLEVRAVDLAKLVLLGSLAVLAVELIRLPIERSFASKAP